MAAGSVVLNPGTLPVLSQRRPAGNQTVAGRLARVPLAGPLTQVGGFHQIAALIRLSLCENIVGAAEEAGPGEHAACRSDRWTTGSPRDQRARGPWYGPVELWRQGPQFSIAGAQPHTGAV